MAKSLLSKIKITPSMIAMGIAFTVSFLLYMWFLRSPYFHVIARWCTRNMATLIPTVIALKTVGIIWPPIPTTVVPVGVIPLMGVYRAYFTDLMGTIIGCSIAYFFGRHYGREFLAKLLGEEFAEKADKLKIKKGRELEALFVLRLLGAGVLVEAVSYGAGLIKMSFRKFLLGTIASHLLVIGPCFILYGYLYRAHEVYLIAASLIITMPLLWFVRGRYFEDEVS